MDGNRGGRKAQLSTDTVTERTQALEEGAVTVRKVPGVITVLSLACKAPRRSQGVGKGCFVPGAGSNNIFWSRRPLWPCQNTHTAPTAHSRSAARQDPLICRPTRAIRPESILVNGGKEHKQV